MNKKINRSTQLFYTLLLSAILLHSITTSAFESKNQKQNLNKNTKGLLSELKLTSDNEDQNTEIAFKSEVLISKTEEKAIASLKKLLDRKKNTPEEDDLLFRLAELYMKRAKSGRFFDLNERYKAQLQNIGIKNQKAKEALEQALIYYNQITKKYPKFIDMDAVLFNSALAYNQLKRNAFAKNNYAELIKNYSKSPLIPDALLEYGEILYTEQNFDQALDKFKNIEKYSNSKAFPYGLYKSSWCYYNSKNTDLAIQQMKKLVELYPPYDPENKRYNLRSEALRDLTLFVGESVAPEKLYSFFKKLTTEQELGEIMLQIGSLYMSHSRHKEISIFTDEFIKKNDDHPAAIQLYALNIEAEEILKNRKKVISQIDNMEEFCQSLSAENKKSCLVEFKKISLETSKKWWEIWLKNKNHTEFSELTEKSFEILLRSDNSQSPDSISRLAYAELLFQLNKFKLSYEQYLKVSEHKSLAQDKKHDALYGALFNLEKLNESTSQPKESNSQQGLLNNKANISLNDYEKQMIPLIERYLKEFPQGEHFVALKFKLGYLNYLDQKYDVALKILKELQNQQVSGIEKNKAQDLILDIYNIQKNYSQLTEFNEIIIAQEKDEKRKSQLSKIQDEAFYAALNENQKKLDESQQIENLVQFSQKRKNSPLAQDALWQALSKGFASGLDVKASALTLNYVELYPKDDKNEEALISARLSFLNRGQLEKVIQIQEKLLKISEERKNKNQLSLKYQKELCEFYSLTINAQISQSKESYQCLWSLESKVSRKDFIPFLDLIYKNAKFQNNTIELNKVQNYILKENIEPYVTQSLIDEAKNLLKLNKYQAAFDLSLKINSRSVSADQRAEARLIQSQILEKEFREQSLKSKLDRLSLVLAMKTEKFDKAFTAYSSTLKMSKTPHIQLETLKGIERLYDHYVDSLTNLPLPNTLSLDEKKQIQNELKPITQEFSQKLAVHQQKIKEFESESKLTGSTSQTVDQFKFLKKEDVYLPFIQQIKISDLRPLWEFRDLSQNREVKSPLFKSSVPSKNIQASKIKNESLPKMSRMISSQDFYYLLESKKFKMAEEFAYQLTDDKSTRLQGLLYLAQISFNNEQSLKALWLLEVALKQDKDKDQNTLNSSNELTKKNIHFLLAQIYEKLNDDQQKNLHLSEIFSQQGLTPIALTLLNTNEILQSSQNQVSQIQLDHLSQSLGEQFNYVNSEELKNKIPALQIELLLRDEKSQNLEKSVNEIYIKNKNNFFVNLMMAKLYERYLKNSKKALEFYSQSKVMTQDQSVLNWLNKKIEFLKETNQLTYNYDSTDKGHSHRTKI